MEHSESSQGSQEESHEEAAPDAEIDEQPQGSEDVDAGEPHGGGATDSEDEDQDEDEDETPEASGASI